MRLVLEDWDGMETERCVSESGLMGIGWIIMVPDVHRHDLKQTRKLGSYFGVRVLIVTARNIALVAYTTLVAVVGL